MRRITRKLDLRWGHWLRYVKEKIVSGNIHLFVVGVAEIVSNRSLKP